MCTHAQLYPTYGNIIKHTLFTFKMIILSWQMSLYILTPMLLKQGFLVSWSRMKTGGWCVWMIFSDCDISLLDVYFIANRYDKREDLIPTSPEMKLYSHLLMEANNTKIKLLQDTHKPLTFMQGYSNIAFHPLHFPPLSVRLQKKTVLMERNPEIR